MLDLKHFPFFFCWHGYTTTDFINYLNLTKESAVVADVLQDITSVGGSKLLDLLHHVMAVLHPPSTVSCILFCRSSFFMLHFLRYQFGLLHRTRQIQKFYGGFQLPKFLEQCKGWPSGRKRMVQRSRCSTPRTRFAWHTSGVPGISFSCRVIRHSHRNSTW